MKAAALLQHLETCGFSVRVDAGDLLISPAVNLTENVRSLVRDHKASLLDLLSQKEYVGWWRTPKCRWQSVVRGASERDAMNRLLTYTPGRGHAEIIVLPAGSHPKDKT